MGNDIFDMMERVMLGHLDHLTRPVKAFLPYDIVKDEKSGKIAVSMAVAGYTKDNLEVTYRDGLLEVNGKGLPYGRCKSRIPRIVKEKLPCAVPNFAYVYRRRS